MTGDSDMKVSDIPGNRDDTSVAPTLSMSLTSGGAVSEVPGVEDVTVEDALLVVVVANVGHLEAS